MCPGKMTPSTSNRKSSKQVMERKRRARMNACLAELKFLLTEVMKSEGTRQNKIEQADVLDMTVRYLREAKTNKCSAAGHSSRSKISKYQLGFSECASEVSKYLANVDAVENDLRSRLLNHLTDVTMSSHQDTESSASQSHDSSCYSSSNRLLESPSVDAVLNNSRNHTRETANATHGNEVNERITDNTQEVKKELFIDTSHTVTNNTNSNDVISGSVTPAGEVAYLIPATSLFQYTNSNIPYPVSNVVIPFRVLQPTNTHSSTEAYFSPCAVTEHSTNTALGMRESKNTVLQTENILNSQSETLMDNATTGGVVDQNGRSSQHVDQTVQLSFSCDQTCQNDPNNNSYLHIEKETRKNPVWRPW